MIRWVKIFAVLFTLIVIAMLALPQLLSTTYVKKRVANQLSELTGRSVTIQGDSSLSLQPYLTVSYTNVNIEDTTPKSETPLVAIETLHAQLNILSALRGKINLAEIALVRPQFNLKIAQDGRKNWHTKNGVFVDRLSTAPDENPPPLTLGNVDIIDGIATIINKQNEQTEELTGINGRLVWPDILSPVELELTAVWRGENFSSNGTINAPFKMLRGSSTELNLSIKSNPLDAQFAGTYNAAEQTAVGDLSALSPSLSRLSEWFRYPISATEYLGKAVVSGKANLSSDAVELPDSEITIGEHKGTGRLQFFLDEKQRPSINGTLAFDTLDLKELPSPARKTGGASANTLDLSLLEGIRVDLRISATDVSSEVLELQNLAASIIIRDANATVDIGNADTMGGQLNGSFEVTAANDQTSINTNILLQNVELEEFTNNIGGSTIRPKGKGDVSFKLKTKGTNYTTLVDRLNGEVSIQGKQGTLEGINLVEILNATQNSPEIAWQSLTGSSPYDDLSIKALITNGVVFLQSSKLQGTGIEVLLGGRADLTQGNLALRGVINETGEAEPDKEKRSLSFFVGGTAISPLFVPLQTIPAKSFSPSNNDNL